MWLMLISKLTLNQGFTLSLENTLFQKAQVGSNWALPEYLGLNFGKSNLPAQK